MKKTAVICITIILLILTAGIVYSADETDALTIIRKMEEMYKINTGRTEMLMIIYPDTFNKDDNRQMKILSYSRGDDESYMEFLSPPSIKGLCILSKGDEQWVYFPSTGRVRKIAGQSKKGSVSGVGGDFTYEDFGGGNFEEKYSFTLLETTDGKWVIQGLPREKDPSYEKVIIHVDRKNYLTQKIEYYTKEDGHVRDMEMLDVKSIGGKLVPTRIVLTNLKKESMTVIITKAAEYDVKIDEKYFNPVRFYK